MLPEQSYGRAAQGFRWSFDIRRCVPQCVTIFHVVSSVSCQSRQPFQLGIARSASFSLSQPTPIIAMVETRGPQIAANAWAFVVLSSIATLLRVYCRGFVTKAFGLDDWLAVVAQVCVPWPTPSSVSSIKGSNANGAMPEDSLPCLLCVRDHRCLIWYWSPLFRHPYRELQQGHAGTHLLLRNNSHDHTPLSTWAVSY